MKFQLSIRSALYLTTAIAVYAAIVALAFRGDFWGKGITFAVTCSLGIWLLSAIAYWMLVSILGMLSIQEQQPTMSHIVEQAPQAAAMPAAQHSTEEPVDAEDKS